MKDKFFTNNWRFNVLLLIPVSNAILENLIDYYPVIGNIRALIYITFIMIAIFFYKRKTSNAVLIIYLFIAYIFVLVVQSSDINTSLIRWLRLSIGLMMFPLGYLLVDDILKYKKILIMFFIALVIFIIDITLSNLLGYGRGYYYEESLNYGGGNVNITKSMTIILLLSPTLFLLNINRKFKYITLILLVTFVLILIGIKRGAILTLFVGLIFYLLFSPLPKRNIKVIIISFFLLSITSGLYLGLFEKGFEQRKEAGRMEISEDEGRYLRTLMVLEAFEKGDISFKLFGSEMFNEYKFFGMRRMLHTDYLNLLQGSGLIGLLLYFLIYLIILLKIKRYVKMLSTQNKIFYNEIFAVSIGLVVAPLILGISGFIQGMNLPSLVFLFYGATLGFLRSEVAKLYTIK